MTSSHRILVDCERMKYPHTGLYHFCLQLGQALQKQDGAEDLVFYLPPAQKDALGPGTQCLLQSPVHKFRLPSLRGFDIWHSTYQASAYFPKRHDIKIVLTVHDLNFLYDETKSASRIKRYLQKMQAKIDRADQVVAISEFTLQDVRKHLKLRDTPARVIYNGSNIHPQEQVQKPATAPDGPFLFTIGTIIAKKNFHTLPSLLHGNNYKLVIAGITQRTEYKARIMAEAKQWGVADRVIFTGPVSESEKHWYLQHCEAFLFPSISEGFGLPVVEAMYFGKPLLLSRHTCLPEIGGDAAYYFENFEPEHMQEVLQRSLEDFHRYDRGPAVCERGKTFSWERCAAGYMEVYRELRARGK